MSDYDADMYITELRKEIERLQQEKDQAVRAMAEMRKKMHDQEDRIEEYHDVCRAVNGGPLGLAEELRTLKPGHSKQWWPAGPC
jgi:chromosome segregation ATPase